MEYQMMRQHIFENRKRQTPKMTFVFVLKKIAKFAIFSLFIFSYSRMFIAISKVDNNSY